MTTATNKLTVIHHYRDFTMDIALCGWKRKREIRWVPQDTTRRCQRCSAAMKRGQPGHSLIQITVPLAVQDD